MKNSLQNPFLKIFQMYKNGLRNGLVKKQIHKTYKVILEFIFYEESTIFFNLYNHLKKG